MRGDVISEGCEIAQVLQLDLVQCCPAELSMPGIATTDDLHTAIPGREATADAFRHLAFAGRSFKRTLLPVQQAIMDHCLTF